MCSPYGGFWLPLRRGVSLLALEEARGEAGAVPASPCHDSKAVDLAALLLEHHTRPGFLFASPAVFGTSVSPIKWPGDVPQPRLAQFSRRLPGGGFASTAKSIAKAARRASKRSIGSSDASVCKEQIKIRSDFAPRDRSVENPLHSQPARMPPPARYLRSHAEGLLLEGGEPGLRPLLITAGKDGGVACRVVHRDRRPSLPQESAHPSLAAQTAPKVRIEGLFGVYAFSGGPYAAVILESEPLLKRDKSTQVFADAKLRWPRDACHAFRLRRATKVAVVPVSNANRRLSKRQAQDEALCLRLLESALRKRPWVFSRDSDAATLTSTRASDARDYALAESASTEAKGVHQGRGRGAAALRAGGRGVPVEPAGPRAGGLFRCGNRVDGVGRRLDAAGRSRVSSTAWRAGVARRRERERGSRLASTAWSAVRESS